MNLNRSLHIQISEAKCSTFMIKMNHLYHKSVTFRKHPNKTGFGYPPAQQSAEHI